MPLLHKDEHRKVVLFRASRIGDFVVATPAFRAIRAALPEAEITLVALPIVEDLVRRCRHVDRFEPFPGMPGIAEQFFDPARALTFFSRMQAEHFDLAIQMHGSGAYSNPVVLMFGARATAGFVREMSDAARLDAAFPMPCRGPEAARLLAFAQFLGAPSQGGHAEFPLWPEDERAAELLLADVQLPLVGVQAGAREATKRWFPERFASVGNELAARAAGTVVLIGGPDDIDVTNRVIAHLKVPHLNLVGTVSLPVLGAVVRRLAVLVTNDSGPAHIAYALQTPTVTVFGGTDPERWQPAVSGPYRLIAHGVPCRPCDYGSCPFDDECLRAVSVEEVLRAAEEVVNIPS